MAGLAAPRAFRPDRSDALSVAVSVRSGSVWHLLTDLGSWTFLMGWLYGWYIAYLAAVGKLTQRAGYKQ